MVLWVVCLVFATFFVLSFEVLWLVIYDVCLLLCFYRCFICGLLLVRCDVGLVYAYAFLFVSLYVLIFFAFWLVVYGAVVFLGLSCLSFGSYGLKLCALVLCLVDFFGWLIGASSCYHYSVLVSYGVTLWFWLLGIVLFVVWLRYFVCLFRFMVWVWWFCCLLLIVEFIYVACLLIELVLNFVCVIIYPVCALFALVCCFERLLHG